MYLDKNTIDQIHQRLQGACSRRNGFSIERELQSLRQNMKETEDALKLLCDKRGCKADQDTAGDNLPVKLLKDKLKEMNDRLCEIEYVDYYPADLVLNFIHELQKETKEYADFEAAQDRKAEWAGER